MYLQLWDTVNKITGKIWLSSNYISQSQNHKPSYSLIILLYYFPSSYIYTKTTISNAQHSRNQTRYLEVEYIQSLSVASVCLDKNVNWETKKQKKIRIILFGDKIFPHDTIPEKKCIFVLVSQRIQFLKPEKM